MQFYTIEEHRHRFAAWCAGRAASVKGSRFKVEDAKRIIEEAKLNTYLTDPSSLPSASDIDTRHRQWRNAIINSASGLNLELSHGVAAKLINIYFKAAFVCGGYHSDERVKALHPPIDNVLLGKLYDKDVGGLRETWKEAKKTRWSKFNSEQYEKVIFGIRKSLSSSSLWEIEQYWQRFQ